MAKLTNDSLDILLRARRPALVREHVPGIEGEGERLAVVSEVVVHLAGEQRGGVACGFREFGAFIQRLAACTELCQCMDHRQL